MAICPNCNVEVQGNFCPLCGMSVPQGPQPPAQAPGQPPAQAPMPAPAPAPYGPPPPTAPAGPMPVKAVAALVLGIIVVIILLIAGAMPWFSANIKNGDETQVDFTFKEAIADTDGTEDEKDLDDMEGDVDDVAGTTSLLLLVGVMMIFIVIILVGLIVGMFYMRMHKFHKLFGNLALLFCFLALIFTLIAPIYYMAAWPDEVDKAAEGEGWPFKIDSFIGSDSTGGYKAEWGPGVGWILAIVGFVLILVTLIIVKLGNDEVQKLAPYAPPIPQQPYMPPPQYPQQPPQYPQQPPQYPQQPPQYPQ
ncbi:MAG: hypothetical protein JSW00_00480 [Thermoplasmata archaeon]|nr:MAG: hypothetical protein JSW00_00480 [Thermoplasmata archaeon]